MSIGNFTERKCPPTDAEILAAVGTKLDFWNELSQWMRESLSAQSEWKYMYGKKYGWALRFQIGGKLLAALYPTHDGFTAQVILNRAALEQASLLHLGNSAKQAIDRAHRYAEGKWLFIPIESKRDAEDAKSLLNLKIAAAGNKKSGKTRQLSASNR